MKSSFKKFLVLFTAVALVVIIFWQNQSRHSTIIQIGETKVAVEIVKSQSALVKGLSGRTSLDADSGMLFIMPKPDIYNFWMKDMLFPIDIIWISNNKVIATDKNAQPEPTNTNLKLYSPPEVVNDILEVNAGFTEKHHIDIGDTVLLLK